MKDKEQDKNKKASKQTVMLKDKKTVSRADAQAANLPIVEKRAIDSAYQMEVNQPSISESIFQHSIFCHTFLPYRNLGNEVREWKQEQGKLKLVVTGGNFINPQTESLEYAGIPYGTKSRLILMYMNTFAIQKQTQIINVKETMSQFIKELGLDVQGKTIKEVKEQLKRIAAASIDMALFEEKKATHIQLKLVRKVDFWLSKNEHQRVFWDSAIELSADYFDSLINHAVPLDNRAVAALSHNAMAMDIYAWLAQRLHRIPKGKPQFVAWQNLKEQFGSGYEKMFHFKADFRKSLILAKTQYMDAKLSEDLNKGFWLEHSPTPIPQKTLIMLPTQM